MLMCETNTSGRFAVGLDSRDAFRGGREELVLTRGMDVAGAFTGIPGTGAIIRSPGHFDEATPSTQAGC